MNSNRQIVLPESLTIGEVAELHDQWKTLPCEDELTIDARQVANVDAAGIQLLLSLVREHVSNGVAVRWETESGRFCDVVRTLGMNSVLGVQ